jgi:hypothetical protein
VLCGCAQQELVATREGMAACDRTVHADYLARVQADPNATAADKAAAKAVIAEYNSILADSRADYPGPATQPAKN